MLLPPLTVAPLFHSTSIVGGRGWGGDGGGGGGDGGSDGGDGSSAACAYCLCVPSWARGGEGHAAALGREAGEVHGRQLLSPTGAMLPLAAYRLAHHATRRAVRGRPYLYVLALGTAPERQGAGCGGTALRAALAAADARGAAVALETMTRKNREMYEHFGFRVVAGGEVRVDGCDDPWVSMLREPKPSAELDELF